MVKATKAIRTAWIAGLISGLLTLLVKLVAMVSPEAAASMGFSVWNWLNVVPVFGLTYGIYRKSRTCAVIMFAYFVISAVRMFAYFVISKVMQLAGGVINPGGVLVATAFGYAFFEGIRGTFAYHRITKAHP
jgi:serine/threonine-protein kinase